jgi:hypothetical protein
MYTEETHTGEAAKSEYQPTSHEEASHFRKYRPPKVCIANLTEAFHGTYEAVKLLLFLLRGFVLGCTGLVVVLRQVDFSRCHGGGNSTRRRILRQVYGSSRRRHVTNRSIVRGLEVYGEICEAGVVSKSKQEKS